MEESQEAQLAHQIKQIELDLYLKRSRLAARKAQARRVALLEPPQGQDFKAWKENFTRLIHQISLLSRGGSSVEDIKMERER
ncbi:hypothetical protein HRbin07_00086 [bacterium HR07]|uniref:Uncharacterized protein n=2 Tax=Candidatus Bipolaricaulota TaxID=67810 RepID=H5SEU6_9BACT|nr:hypothetical protein HGMM_F17E10C12 [uncultured Acetothermia bacterium]BAL58332.1 hypothetical protein HGMM_OP1C027 [Candidatus Acetothermum autotrophicum]GBC75894.1 hypothetical protein HRbin07_00086 [bacterium HR07]